MRDTDAFRFRWREGFSDPEAVVVSLDGKMKTFRDILVEDLGEEVAEIAESGPYVGDGSPYPRDWAEEDPPYYSALRIDSKTVWPEGSDLDSVFPLETTMLTKGWNKDGGMTSFLEDSKPVQDDFKATTARIGKEYDDLRMHFVSGEKPKPGAISDLRALREETCRALANYADRTMPHTERMRETAAVLYLEARKASAPGAGKKVDLLEQSIRTAWPDFAFVSRYWAGVLKGGPRFPKDATALAVWLEPHGISKELLRVQSEQLHQLRERRDEIIREALPVEYRRIACENILWKVAHGRPVLPWGVDDAASLLTPRNEFDAGSEKTKRVFFGLYDFIKGKMKSEDWKPSKDGWTTKVKVLKAFIVDKKNGQNVETLSRTMKRLESSCAGNDLPVVKSGGEAANNGEAFVNWVLEIGDKFRPYWE